ncbi:Fur family transcriptional regulator [Candidatus Nitrosotalea okcheonensis]|uniref:Fe2+/Zn2+ uptake regulation protein n=1 Tax=Candidatus Nitrosotalea okcheonensis TaxID=1903276 RepID=A0A2H1FGE9_9ARCH|nr:transcriptional repressor [Candidatus Nitrosotalea okcheonensis]SMH71833.1 Fe2+/Zn2+ uptake regulation protein [Candidatus Nitrosotalea okcheonensis]
MQYKLDQVVLSLRKEGFRITPQRIAIVDYVMKSEEHPSAEQIHKFVQKKYPMVSLSTVYKTLDLMRSNKLVNEIEVKGESRFDANTGEHINLICLNCGKIEDLDDASIKEIQSRVATRSRYRILRGNFDFYGYCSLCKSKV